MILHAFYNLEGVGDILLVRLGTGEMSSYKKNNHVIALFDNNNQIIGYNILEASNYFENLGVGLVKITNEFIDALNKVITKEQYEPISFSIEDRFIVGKVIELEDHPDSDHLHVCQVQVKDEIHQIVCGASNVAKGQLVVVATVGAVMPSGLVIVPSKLRGLDSNGMLCSSRELNLPMDHKPGILVLNENEYKLGSSFF